MMFIFTIAMQTAVVWIQSDKSLLGDELDRWTISLVKNTKRGFLSLILINWNWNLKWPIQVEKPIITIPVTTFDQLTYLLMLAQCNINQYYRDLLWNGY
jgi:hypothetical protein